MDSNADGSARDLAAVADLRSTAKWLAASAGAVLAVAVAGVQIRDVRDMGAVLAAVALVGAAVAAAAVVAVLLSAGAVLVAEGPSIRKLADLDEEDGGAFPRPRLDEPKSPIMKYLLVERRLELLGPRRDSIKALLVDRSAAYDGLTVGKTVEIDGQKFNPASGQNVILELRLVADDLDARSEAVVAAADRWTVRQAFKRLNLTMLVAAVAFALGFGSFVWLTAMSQPGPQITEPIAAQVTVPSGVAAAGSAGFDPGCAGMTLKAFMVAGHLDDPVVVTEPVAGCPAQQARPGKWARVVPGAP